MQQKASATARVHSACQVVQMSAHASMTSQLTCMSPGLSVFETGVQDASGTLKQQQRTQLLLVVTMSDASNQTKTYLGVQRNPQKC